MGQPQQDSQNRKGRMGRLEQHKKNRIDRTGLPAQDYQEYCSARTVRAGLSGQDSGEGPAGKGQPKQGSHNRAATTGQLELERQNGRAQDGMQNRTASTVLPEETTVRTGLPEEDC
jgi:hypothetical protein